MAFTGNNRRGNMAATNGVKKNSVVKWEKVRGLWDRSLREFLPYPLPVTNLEIHDESWFALDMSLGKDDPSAWSNVDGTPLMVEFRIQFFMPESKGELSRYLLRRARELGVEPEELPEKATLKVTEEEEKAIYKAKEAIREALWYAILRWANLEELDAPNQLRVPAKVPVGKAKRKALKVKAEGMAPIMGMWQDPWYPKDHVPVKVAVGDSNFDLRRRAQKHLRGEALKAFNAYCDYWDKQHAKIGTK
jgi:hypothetical protein